MTGSLRFAVLLLALPFGAACSSVDTYEPRAVFDVEEHEPSRREGTGRIAGQAFLKASGGEVKYGAGDEVLLLPATSFTEEWYEKVVREDMVPAVADHYAPVEDYVRRTRANAEGRFEFSSLPAGRWFVYCLITWEETRNQSAFGPSPLFFYDYHRTGQRRRRHRRYWPYPYLWPHQQGGFETTATVGGIAHAAVELGDGEAREGLLVTR